MEIWPSRKEASFTSAPVAPDSARNHRQPLERGARLTSGWRGILLGAVVTVKYLAGLMGVFGLVSGAVAEISLPRHETRVLTLERADAVAADTPISVEVIPPGAVTLITEPVFLSGEKRAFLRFRGEQPGPATITADGQVVTFLVTPEDSPVRAAVRLPEITAPAEGAVVWGEVNVGVELWSDAARGLGTGRVHLELSNGQRLEPVESWEAVDGPFRRFRFEFQPGAKATGAVSFTAVIVEKDGTSARSEVRRCLLAGEDSKVVAGGECEALRGVERPEKYPGTLKVAFDPAASEGRFVRTTGKRPALLLPIEPKEEGWYALALRGRGELGGGTFPSLQIARGEKGEKLTSARVTGAQWQTLAAGRPFRLKPGQDFLVVELGNELRLKDVPDRTLDLDRWELRYLGPKKPGESWGVAFSDAENTGELNGPVTVRARTFRTGGQGKPPADARIALLINGTKIAKRTGAEAAFRVDPWQLRAGANELQLQAERTGAGTASSEVLSLMLPEGASREKPVEGTSREIELEVASDWKLEDGAFLREGVVVFNSNSAVLVPLPDEISGASEFFLELEGDHFEGAPRAKLELVSGGKDVGIGEVNAGKEFAYVKTGSAEMRKGTNRLRVSFINDAYEKDKGDRNLRLRHVRVVSRRVEDTTEPEVAVDYPASGAVLDEVDAVVARVYDNAGVAAVQLWLDDAPYGPPVTAPERGALLIPLLHPADGADHVLSVQVTDGGGNEQRSAPVPVRFARPDGEQLTGTYERAVRLLNRFAYGPEPAELARLLAKGEAAWLEEALKAEADEGGAAEARLRFPENNDRNVARRGLQEALGSGEPVRTRFGFWVENHFSTWLRKTGAGAKWQEHLAFSALGIAPFFDLLATSAHSPAMLTYLDQRQSFAGKINENYAREIMELHTLGVRGGYGQEDVTAAAHLLAGWTVQDDADPLSGGGDLVGSFRYEPFANGSAPQRLLGLASPEAAPEERYDRVRNFLELLAWHPSTARFVSSKLVEHYVAHPAPPELTDEVAAEFRRTGGDMRALLRLLAGHPAFWKRDLPPRLASPLDFGLRLARLAGSQRADAVDEMMSNSGKALWDRASPDGYPEASEEYADSNYMLQKWRFAQTMSEPFAAQIPAALWREPTEENDGALIDWVAVRLTGARLGDRSQEAARSVLEQEYPDSRQRLLQLVSLVAQLPEAQIR